MAAAMELIYSSVSIWPLAPQTMSRAGAGRLRIEVMDSSWNPPSLAHYAIAVHEAQRYDAHLLLLSSHNVDKVFKKEGFQEKKDMMVMVAKRMRAQNSSCKNVAVGTIAAATFADKTPILLDFVKPRLAGQQCTLAFFIGFDTVTRLFMDKYYGNSKDEMERIMSNFFDRDGCEVVCARRPAESVAQQDVAGQDEQELLSRPFVRQYVEAGKLRMVDIPGTSGISSTKIRTVLGGSEPDTVKLESLKSLTFPDIAEFCLKTHLYVSKDKDASRL